MNSTTGNSIDQILGSRQAMRNDLAAGKIRPTVSIDELTARYGRSDRHATRIEFRDALASYCLETAGTILVLTSPDLETVLGVTDDCGGAFEDPAIQAKLSRMANDIDETTMHRLAEFARMGQHGLFVDLDLYRLPRFDYGDHLFRSAVDYGWLVRCLSMRTNELDLKA